MFEEFWASQRAVSWCLRSFGRHVALSHDVSGVLGVTVRSLMTFEEFRASRCAFSCCLRSLGDTVRSLMMFEEF